MKSRQEDYFFVQKKLNSKKEKVFELSIHKNQKKKKKILFNSNRMVYKL